jgi:hypothetical protein
MPKPSLQGKGDFKIGGALSAGVADFTFVPPVIANKPQAGKSFSHCLDRGLEPLQGLYFVRDKTDIMRL